MQVELYAGGQGSAGQCLDLSSVEDDCREVLVLSRGEVVEPLVDALVVHLDRGGVIINNNFHSLITLRTNSNKS